MSNDATAATPRSSEFVSLVGDLGFSTKIREVATAQGWGAANARNLTRFIELIGVNIRGVIIDLTHPDALGALQWLQEARGGSVPTLAYYPHVERALGESALRFPFAQVVTRSKLDVSLLAFIPSNLAQSR